MAASRVMGRRAATASEEAANPRLSEGPHGGSTVKGETLTLCKEWERSGNGSDTDRGRGAQGAGFVFTSLYHHICDVDNLRACYDILEADKATGVDGVTKEEYGKNLEEKPSDLSGRLKRMGYRPEPKRRSYIPKAGSEKGRPLGISNLEDKIVEEATKTDAGTDL